MRGAQQLPMFAVALATMVQSSLESSLPAQYSREYADFATTLQQTLLSNYNTNVPPKTLSRTPGNVAASEAGTDVKIQMRVFKVSSIEAANGRMSIKVWLRHSWQDTRLAWNESEHGGISMIALSTDMPQQIWIPDLQPYNSLNPISDTLAKEVANVYSDGSIFWSRAGMIDIMCKFSGLVAFPYDNLQCALEVGGWSWSGSHQGIEPFEAGASTFSNQEATAGASYTEYTIKEITAEPVICAL